MSYEEMTINQKMNFTLKIIKLQKLVCDDDTLSEKERVILKAQLDVMRKEVKEFEAKKNQANKRAFLKEFNIQNLKLV